MYIFGKDFSTQSEKNYRNIKEYAKALEEYNWHFMVTFTTSQYLSKDMAREKMGNIHKYYSNVLNQYCIIFWVAEPHESGNYHVHALFDTEDKKESTIINAWNMQFGKKAQSNNRITIDRYQKGKGGNIYTLKGIHDTKVDYDFEV